MSVTHLKAAESQCRISAKNFFKWQNPLSQRSKITVPGHANLWPWRVNTELFISEDTIWTVRGFELFGHVTELRVDTDVHSSASSLIPLFWMFVFGTFELFFFLSLVILCQSGRVNRSCWIPVFYPAVRRNSTCNICNKVHNACV